ncbi:MAG: hypothetical protein CO141_02375 [Candidatus Moranbacteria bacterium CG_4_9_14_3_um_filter_42_9]|nr:MAG: hypothetical protein CO141_02375 [Candidatus Moranbacteria bacterium CG_4_9_14_3_um_filter_42_9]
MGKQTQKSLKLAILAVFIGVFALVGLIPVIASSITDSNVIKLVNEARAKKGLEALQENPKLSAAAQAKAQDMLKNDYFAHNSPSGKTPWYWMEKSGYDYKYAGENLAMNFTSAEEEQKAWMKSASHRKNILNANYQEIGVAVAEGKIDGESTIVAVQMFGSRPNFVPVAPKVTDKIPEENKIVVLGEENNVPLLAESQELLSEDILVNDFVPKDVLEKTAPAAVSGSWWSALKEKVGGENRPGWLAPLALNVLLAIAMGNVVFLAYSFARKIIQSGKKGEADAGEQKILVENLEDGEEEVSVPVKVSVLNVPQLKLKT